MNAVTQVSKKSVYRTPNLGFFPPLVSAVGGDLWLYRLNLQTIVAKNEGVDTVLTKVSHPTIQI